MLPWRDAALSVPEVPAPADVREPGHRLEDQPDWRWLLLLLLGLFPLLLNTARSFFGRSHATARGVSKVWTGALRTATPLRRGDP
ncbi:hypothetical protein [Methylibium rhizosphaerae]|uniref:hypothetical protein n=1 Tax=Methylibium rhizosphaerae TaxID=2570323 RepID=UPI00112E859D|nr:hypothetical protein [Methylibium rhizosphaerae]